MAYSLRLWLMAIGWWNKINQCRKLKLNLTQTWGVCMSLAIVLIIRRWNCHLTLRHISHFTFHAFCSHYWHAHLSCPCKRADRFGGCSSTQMALPPPARAAAHTQEQWRQQRRWHEKGGTRAGQNHIHFKVYTVDIRYCWQGYHHTYGHLRCRYTVLANPRWDACFAFLLGVKSTRTQGTYLGLARTVYIRCIHGIHGREISKYTVIYGVYIRFWPTQHSFMCTCVFMPWSSLWGCKMCMLYSDKKHCLLQHRTFELETGPP